MARSPEDRPDDLALDAASGAAAAAPAPATADCRSVAAVDLSPRLSILIM